MFYEKEINPKLYLFLLQGLQAFMFAGKTENKK